MRATALAGGGRGGRGACLCAATCQSSSSSLRTVALGAAHQQQRRRGLSGLVGAALGAVLGAAVPVSNILSRQQERDQLHLDYLDEQDRHKSLELAAELRALSRPCVIRHSDTFSESLSTAGGGRASRERVRHKHIMTSTRGGASPRCDSTTPLAPATHRAAISCSDSTSSARSRAANLLIASSRAASHPAVLAFRPAPSAWAWRERMSRRSR